MVVLAVALATVVVVTAVGSVLCVVVVVMAVDLYDGEYCMCVRIYIYRYILRNGGTIQTKERVPILHATTTTLHRAMFRSKLRWIGFDSYYRSNIESMQQSKMCGLGPRSLSLSFPSFLSHWYNLIKKNT